LPKIYIDDSIPDDWIGTYLGFLSDEQLLALRREKPYPLMNEERQALVDPVRNIALSLLPLALQYPEIRNFIEIFNTRFIDMMQWLEKYNDLIPKVDPNPKDLEALEKHRDKSFKSSDFSEDYPLIPLNDLDILISAFNDTNKIIVGLIPFYKAFPHSSSRISSFIFDLPREYITMLGHINENFKYGRYKVIDT
jgi:hypothetical protein